MTKKSNRRWWTVEWHHKNDWYPMDLRPTRAQARKMRASLIQMGSDAKNLRVTTYARID